MLQHILSRYKKAQYRKYLRSDQWKHKRMRVLRRDKFKCIQCGSKHYLHVHHKTYKNIFNEPLNDLVTLCQKCHKKVHAKKRNL